MTRIYLSPPELAGSELAMVEAAVRSGWIAPVGPDVDAFEAEICARIGVPHALATSSGTAALHLALLALGVTAGDEVWTSTLTFAASANAIKYVGATPVFIDCDRETWNMDPGLFVEALDQAARDNRLPAAVIIVDLYGQCADYAPIVDACRRHGVWLIEDAAEALGATYRDRPAGLFGDLAILSFNGNKIITTSGGGMLLGHDRAHVERARYLATQAREPAVHYEHREVGFNYRLSNLLAAVGRAQLRDLDRRIEARRTVNRSYRDTLGPLPGWSFMPEATYGRSTCWLTCAVIEHGDGPNRDDIIAHLASEDIESRPVWKPLHLQPVFSSCRVIRGTISEHLFARGLCLPSGSSLTSSDVERVSSTIVGLYRRNKGVLDQPSDVPSRTPDGVSSY